MEALSTQVSEEAVIDFCAAFRNDSKIVEHAKAGRWVQAITGAESFELLTPAQETALNAVKNPKMAR